jgi:hypothetical protein
MSNWLDELEQIRKDDEVKQAEEQLELDLSVLGSQGMAKSVLTVSQAYNLLRRVQGVLLGGKGKLDPSFNRVEQYDLSMILFWQGPVSKARNPRLDDPTEFYYIIVGAWGKALYVNDEKLKDITPETLKDALVWAAKNPGVWEGDPSILFSDSAR